MALDKPTPPPQPAAGRRPPFEQIGDLDAGAWEIRTTAAVPNHYAGGTSEIVAEVFCEIVYDGMMQDTGKRIEHWLYFYPSSERFTNFTTTWHHVASDSGQVATWLSDRENGGYYYVRAECDEPVQHN